MKVRIAGVRDREAWDRYVQAHRQAAPYSLFAWKEAIEQAYGHQGCYLLAEERGKIRGILPLICFDIPWVYRALISLPYCDLGGILADSPAIKNILLQKAIAVAKNLHADRLEIRSNSQDISEDNCCGRHMRVRRDKVRMLLSLPDSSEALWFGFKSKLRSQIRKAEKNGLRFQWGTSADIHAFYDVFSRNMHALGSPVHSKEWIRQIYVQYGPAARMGLVYHGSVPVGCGLILCTRDSVSIPWASTLREYNHLSPNMLLYWNFLQFAVDTGRTTFDFGRSTPGEGTYRFKRQWGAESFSIFWYQLSKKTHKVIEQNSSKRMALQQSWNRLPLNIANEIGPLLRRFINL